MLHQLQKEEHHDNVPLTSLVKEIVKGLLVVQVAFESGVAMGRSRVVVVVSDCGRGVEIGGCRYAGRSVQKYHHIAWKLATNEDHGTIR